MYHIIRFIVSQLFHHSTREPLGRNGMPFLLPASPKGTLHTIGCDSAAFVAFFGCKGERVLLSLGSTILSAAHIGCAYGPHRGKPSNKPQSIR